MAQLAGTTDTYDLKGQREDLMNKIFMITPEDTPFMSNIGRNRGSAVRHEWQTDVLAAPDTSNAQIEGDEYVYADRSPTVRVGNLMQISRKPVNISRTLEVVDKAGRQSEVAYQVAKAGKELKKDMEAILLANQASVVGNNSTARKLGGFAAWLTTNVSRGATAAAGGYNTGTGLVVGLYSWNGTGLYRDHPQDGPAGSLYVRRQPEDHHDGRWPEVGLLVLHWLGSDPSDADRRRGFPGYHHRSG
jgi:hypothetical protein